MYTFIIIYIYIYIYTHIYIYIHTYMYTGAPPRSAVFAAVAAAARERLRTILDVPKPRYGGAPNLCEDIY